MRMSRFATVAVLLLAAVPSALAMNNYDDPRTILSFMDKSLPGARDILRVTTSISDDGELVFRVKMRAEPETAMSGDYLLLQVRQSRSHQFLVPIDPEFGDTVLAYSDASLASSDNPGLRPGNSLSSSPASALNARRIASGVEFVLPLTWLDYSEKIDFDAYVVRGQPSADGFLVAEVYDRAAKGMKRDRMISPITLLNNLCATRR